ncbi:ATP synthase subunit delta [Nocardioides flavus (ex Wang et al. 2016)]|uniref:ATP synthase subunit delta n=1 Tax=Nocardioides flavus (ex Wang et al. 2016) TaxID=2058780 RepID=A0ABQ3HL19_9ACTN|nr:F0F1 ATP synthase subunit delta [Nocardioides flavus (ex Wang et al. 2016)]GHE17605.1 ATP synthase subunit delta [Nocardioides flavus (ex Wang et al. 2016)]
MLRGASADAYAATAAALTGADDAGAVGRDLFAVADLLRAEPGLRRVATDASVAGEAKAGLLRDVLAGKVSDLALAVVTLAVAQRWTASRDLADALERLGVVAVARSAGGDAGRLEDELFVFGQVVQDNPELRDALSDPARSRADKARLLGDLLGDKVLPATVALVQQSLSGSYRTVGVALADYQKVAADVRGQAVATVRVARPLADDDRQRLAGALARTYGREIHLNVVVDPEVIGGIRVEIGDDVIDGTVSSRLDEARRRLAG